MGSKEGGRIPSLGTLAGNSGLACVRSCCRQRGEEGGTTEHSECEQQLLERGGGGGLVLMTCGLSHRTSEHPLSSPRFSSLVPMSTTSVLEVLNDELQ